MEFKKFNLKFVKFKPNFYLKYIRLASNALNLCKIYAKFNAKYVRSTPKFKVKLCKIGVECVEFM